MEDNSVIVPPPSTTVESKKPSKDRQSKVKDKDTIPSNASLFSEITDLVNLENSNTSNQSSQPISGDSILIGLLSMEDNSSHSDPLQPTAAQDPVIINNVETGEARLVHRPGTLAHHSHESDPSFGSPTADTHSLESEVIQGQEQSTHQTNNSGARSEFSFHLPSVQSDRHVTINRSLSQDGNGGNTTPLINLDHSSDSDSSGDSSVLSDSDTSTSPDDVCHRGNRHRWRQRQEQQLIDNLLDSKSDATPRSRYKDADELLQKLFICVSGRADHMIN